MLFRAIGHISLPIRVARGDDVSFMNERIEGWLNFRRRRVCSLLVYKVSLFEEEEEENEVAADVPFYFEINGCQDRLWLSARERIVVGVYSGGLILG